MDGQPLRAVADRTVIRPSIDIARCGFGMLEVTHKNERGVTSSERCRLTFRLCCSHVVAFHYECGGVCLLCRKEIEGATAISNVACALAPIEMDWLATPCRACWKSCEFPFCALGTCQRHSAVAADGKLYCPQHFLVITDQIEFETIKKEKGELRAKTGRFIKSLFFDEKLT